MNVMNVVNRIVGRKRRRAAYAELICGNEMQRKTIESLQLRIAELEAENSVENLTASTNQDPSVAISTDHIDSSAHYIDVQALVGQRQVEVLLGPNKADRWYSEGYAKFYPLLFRKNDIANNFGDYIRKYVLKDMTVIPKIFYFDRPVFTFGSCFASRIRDYLQANHSIAKSVWIPEGLNNTYSLVSYFRWALNDEGAALRDTAFIKTPDGKIMNWIDGNGANAGQIGAHLKEASGFIFTLGMTEVWRNKESRAVFWRGVPREAFDAELHEFYQSTFADNLKNLIDLVGLIREKCGDVPIVFTLSPVPIGVTFRETSAVIADCASKSTLRAVLNELMQVGLKNIFYWPSFEVVRWLGSHIDKATFTVPFVNEEGKIVSDSFHVPDWAVAGIIETFVDDVFHRQNRSDVDKNL